MRRTLPLLLLPLLFGCIKKPEPVRASKPTAVAAVFLFDQEEDTAVRSAAASLVQASTTLLAGHDLVVTPVPEEAWAPSFATMRSTRQRMLHLLETVDADVVLLVETRARFGSLIEGRYRWTVPAQITLVRRGSADFPVQAEVEVPVFLRFAHEQGDAAVEAAGATITRRLGRMADDLLRDGTPTSRRVRPGSDAIYFVMVDRHRNGDVSNDADADPADPQAFHGGDLAGVRQDLDRLAALGFKSVWLSPVWTTRATRIGPWGAFHGYWVEDPAAVEPRFGTEAELVALADALRDRGMGLILDVVTNHVAPGSPLLDAHPDWVHRNGDIVRWDDPVEAVTHDVHGLPDLAQEVPAVRDWLVDAGQRWLRVLRPEGFRLDAVRHVGAPFWADFNGAMRATGGDDLVLVGELFDGDAAAVAASWRAGGFSGMFDFPLHYALVDVFCGDASVGRLASTLAQDGVHPDPRQLVTFLDNHDLPRISGRCSADGMGQALSTLLALRGRPAVTWGTEAGLDGIEEPANRADFPWDAERRWEPVIARGLRLRADHPALRSTDREVVAYEEGRFAWLQRAGEAAVVAVNRTPEPWTLPLPSGHWRALDAGTELGVSMTVPARSIAIAMSDVAPARGPTGEVTVAVTLSGAPLVGDVTLVGAGAALGAWDPAAGIAARKEGAVHVAEARLPIGSVAEYKFVVRGEGGEITWESRGNRYLLVSEDQAVVSAQWEA